MQIRTIVQARYSSQRLPGKVLHAVEGKPLLAYMLEGLRGQPGVPETLVATSDEPSDDRIAELCHRLGVCCIRGSLDNVASRYMQAIESLGLDAFIRLSGDSPLFDYRLIVRALELYSQGDFDMVTNKLRRTFPKGHTVEVVSASTYREAFPRMIAPSDLEHVTSYYYSHAGDFTIRGFESGHDWGHLQLCVDTPEDMQQFERIVSQMDRPHWEYTVEEIVELAELA